MRELHCQRIRHDNGDASDNDAGTLRITSVPGDLDMFEYNDLTKELLAQGYDADHHPSYVRLPTSGIHNIYGGFEFVRMHAEKFVYETGCGLLVMGRNVIDDMTCMGKTHSHENNNPVVNCPFKKIGCQKNFAPELSDRRSGTEYCFTVHCECHRTDKPYDYSKSVEFERDKNEKRKQEKYEKFAQDRHGRVCRVQANWNDTTEEWYMNYNPKNCVNGCPHQNARCDILGKTFSGKKGNVYYDVKATWKNIKRDDEQIGLFDTENSARIEKGLQVFKSPVPIEICEAYAKIGQDEILWLYEVNHSYEKFWNHTMTYEIINIRAEQKETRNLLQDLEDIKNGISVTHASDNINQKKQLKKERAVKAKDVKRRKFLKQIEQTGWLGMDEVDRKNARKVLAHEEITDADKKHRESINKPKEKNEQLSLFDFMEV